MIVNQTIKIMHQAVIKKMINKVNIFKVKKKIPLILILKEININLEASFLNYSL